MVTLNQQPYLSIVQVENLLMECYANLLQANNKKIYNFLKNIRQAHALVKLPDTPYVQNAQANFRYFGYHLFAPTGIYHLAF